MNTEQKTAAEYLGGPLLVLAGPGTGKTTTLVGRYKFLLDNSINTKQILCCTFSRKAAAELKERISAETNLNLKASPIGTFHSLALRVLRSIGDEIGVPRDFDIWTKEYERLKVVRELQTEQKANALYRHVPKDDSSASAALEFIDAVREELLDPEDASIRAAEKNNLAEIAHSEIYYAYEAYLDKENKIDFPRMAQLACKALRQNNEREKPYNSVFKHILVDEFQDINLAQKTLIDLILEGGSKLWAVGDDYQAIYGWRGSNVRYMLDFHKGYPNAKVLGLSQNYRSGRHILDAAKNLSVHFLEAYKKNLVPTRDIDGQVFIDEVLDANEETDAIIDEVTLRLDDGVPLSDIAILSRTNSRPKKIAARLIQKGYPVSLQGGVAPFEELEAKQLISAAAIYSGIFLNRDLRWPRIAKDLYGFAKKLQQDEKPWGSAIKALASYMTKRPPSSLDDADIEHRTEIIDGIRDRLLESEKPEQFFSIMEASLLANPDEAKVFVGTIHSAKGLEWDSVFLLGFEDGHLPQRQSISPQVYDEERRIAYVGITRAKNFLLISCTTRKGDIELEASPFISEMEGPKAKATPKTQKKVTEKSPVQEKIEGLLTKAKDTASSPAEAEEAEKMAHKLMVKYKISIKGVKPKFVQPAGLSAATRQRDQFKQNSATEAEHDNFVQEQRKSYWERVVENSIKLRTEKEAKLAALAKKAQTPNESPLADGSGENISGWDTAASGPGFLQEVGYTTRKEGPTASERQNILFEILTGQIELPQWLSDSVYKQWGAPNSAERFNKMRNTLNVALGTQKGRSNPSAQAIRKWEEDISYLDNSLRQNLD